MAQAIVDAAELAGRFGAMAPSCCCGRAKEVELLCAQHREALDENEQLRRENTRLVKRLGGPQESGRG